jgi:hypothetical protein
MGSPSVSIKGDFVTEISRFCDIFHICCRRARQHVDNVPVLSAIGDSSHWPITAISPLADQ